MGGRFHCGEDEGKLLKVNFAIVTVCGQLCEPRNEVVRNLRGFTKVRHGVSEATLDGRIDVAHESVLRPDECQLTQPGGALLIWVWIRLWVVLGTNEVDDRCPLARVRGIGSEAAANPLDGLELSAG